MTEHGSSAAPARHSGDEVPARGLVDRSAALLLEGYRFIMNRRRRFRADAFETRLMGQRAVCMGGRDAVRLFYDQSKFQRSGALPGPVLRTLFGDHPVHSLDDEAHRHRKALFMALLTPESAVALADAAAKRWDAAVERWATRPCIVLFDEAVEVLGAAVYDWAGVPAQRADPALARDLATIVDGFGSVGTRHIRARLARKRCDRWAAQLIAAVRAGDVAPPDGTALRVIAEHRDTSGQPLDESVAAVELLNVLRPTVAVAWFIPFAALALHQHPEWRERLADRDDMLLEGFAHEVRRLYPFVPMLGARVRRPFSWRGHTFPRRRLVLLDVYGTLHDPTLWPEPDGFQPDRYAGEDPDPYAFIPQGGGDAATGHRCPGERVAIELIKGAARLLVRLRYDVPDQNLRVRLSRFPTRPRSGFIMRDVRREPHETGIGSPS